jgi:Transcriptional regulator
MTTATEPTTEDRVKSAAVRLFSAKGFAATGIREIAHEAGISVASLYHYMDTKEELLLSLMLDGMNSLLEPATQVLASEGGPSEHLVRLVDIHVSFHCSRAALARVTDAELRSLSPEPRRSVIDLRDAYENLWLSSITDGKSDGTFTVAEPRLATLAVLEMCTGVSHWYSPDGRFSVERIARYYAGLALRLLGHGGADTIDRLELAGQQN